MPDKSYMTLAITSRLDHGAARVVKSAHRTADLRLLGHHYTASPSPDALAFIFRG